MHPVNHVNRLAGVAELRRIADVVVLGLDLLVDVDQGLLHLVTGVNGLCITFSWLLCILIEEVNTHVFASGIQADLVSIIQVESIEVVEMDHELIAKHYDLVQRMVAMSS